MAIMMPSIGSSQLASSAVSAVSASNGGGRSSGRSEAGTPSIPYYGSKSSRNSSALSRTNSIADAVLSDQQFSREQATTAYERSSAEAQKQRDFEERMSNTAYKRAAEQLRELGINPYVMLSGFSGASTPSGSAGSGYVGQSVSASSARASQYATNARFISSLLGTVANVMSSLGSTALKAAMFL